MFTRLSSRRAAGGKSILVVGSHPLANPSMRRYSRLLWEAYEVGGVVVEARSPSDFLSRRQRNLHVRKWAVYLEQLVFAVSLRARVRKTSLCHVADHSDAVYLNLLPSGIVDITCHDLIAVRAARGAIPEHRTRATGRLYQWLVARGLSRARTVYAVSRTTAADLKLHLGITAEVLYNPIDGGFAAAAQANLEESPAKEPYALIVSTTGWRKRRILALQSWARVAQGYDRPLNLIIIGPPLDSLEQEFVSRSGYDARVQTMRGISDAELASVYARAEFLIQASKYEGFAWPILEANFFGVVALCADEPILRETGEGNVFFNPDSPLGPEVVNDLFNLIEDTEARSLLAVRASSFSVEAFTRQLMDSVHGAGRARES